MCTLAEWSDEEAGVLCAGELNTDKLRVPWKRLANKRWILINAHQEADVSRLHIVKLLGKLT